MRRSNPEILSAQSTQAGDERARFHDARTRRNVNPTEEPLVYVIPDSPTMFAHYADTALPPTNPIERAGHDAAWDGRPRGSNLYGPQTRCATPALALLWDKGWMEADLEIKEFERQENNHAQT